MSMNKGLKGKFNSWLRGDEDILGGLGSEGRIRQEEPPHAPEKLPDIESLERREIDAFKRIYPILAVALGLITVICLVLTVSYLPRYGSADAPTNNEVSRRYIEKGVEETGATNIVAGMILDYRAFDTLGESHVLFTALCAVMILLVDDSPAARRKNRLEDRIFDLTHDVVLREVVRVLVPIILVFGAYILLNGHLSPGGGFSGGAVLGAGLILYSLAFGFDSIEKFLSRSVFKTVSLCALAFYSLSKGYSFFMGAHGLETGIPKGIPGNIISAGLILPLDIAVGMVVACTMYGIYSIFQRGRI